MANIRSAKKRARQNPIRALRNASRMSRVRTYIKGVVKAVALGDKDKAREALRKAESEIMRAAQKGLFHPRMGSRKVSRLSAQVKEMNAS